jgi:cell division protein FtsQ
MDDEKVITMDERIPRLKEQRRQKANRRFIFYISVFFLLILIVVYLQTPLSKVGSIKVSGNHYLSSSEVIKASSLTGDTGFWDVEPEVIEKKIQKAGQIESARVDKQLPNDITISVQEFGRIAYVKEGSRYYPILENGFRLSQLTKNDIPVNAPLLINWKQDGKIAEMAGQLSQLPEGIIHRISDIHLSPTNEFPNGIKVFMNDGYEVWATIGAFADKMKTYQAIVQELDPDQRGIIHMRVGTYFETYDEMEEPLNEPEE